MHLREKCEVAFMGLKLISYGESFIWGVKLVFPNFVDCGFYNPKIFLSLTNEAADKKVSNLKNA